MLNTVLCSFSQSNPFPHHRCLCRGRRHLLHPQFFFTHSQTQCKRLKLKCDRRNPCGSCTKRDTIPRCVYSPAAAEKVYVAHLSPSLALPSSFQSDLHSLNNRLMQVEAMLAQITGGQFTSSYPLSFIPPPAPQSSSQSVLLLPGGTNTPILPSEQLGLSALTFPLHQVAALWLVELNLGIPLPACFAKPFSDSTSSSARSVKLEPSSAQLTLSSHQEDDLDTIGSNSPRSPSSSETQLLLPPISMYYSATDSIGTNLPFSVFI